MQSNDWMRAGEDILHSVLDAVEQQDFSGLSKNIEEKINDTLWYVGERLNESKRRGNATQDWANASRERESAGQDWAGAAKQERERTGQNWANTNRERERTGQDWVNAKQERARAEQERLHEERRKREARLALYMQNPPGTYSGVTFQVLGIIGISMFGLAAFVLTIVALATGYFGIWLADLICCGLLAGSACMFAGGLKLKKRVDHFHYYVRMVEEKQYGRIEELAHAVGKTKKFVEKEIRQMIDKGFFLQGHLDHTGTTLITSNDMYEKYLQAEQARKERELSAAKQPAAQGEKRSYPEKVQHILDEGNRYIQHIHACNDAIPGEVMSQKLEKLENIMKRIFEQLKKDPESCDDLQKLMNYYLPTTTKLIDAYQEMAQHPSYGSNNIENTKKEIENTLDLINDAFARLLDDMFEDMAWDISADISTMKTMLAKEGLTGEKDFQL